MNAPLRIALCAGEASGDGLGADLIQSLKVELPHTEFAGIGGPHMRAAGMDCWWDAGDLSVMGLAEVLRHLPRLLKLRREFRARVLAWAPDVFIGIDAPDFNLSVEKWLKTRGITTTHYVSPSVWAWREERAARMGESADQVLCLFPMEPAIYARHGVAARFVGHSLADAIPLKPDHAAARAFLGIADDARVLAVLPGSRLGEIQRMLPVFLQAAQQVETRLPGVQLVIPAANAQCRTTIDAIVASSVRDGATTPIHITNGQAQAAMIASDVVLLASGTAALEAMLCKRPMVVGHRINALTYTIVRSLKMLKSDWVSLPNILAGRTLVPECLQENCTPDRLSAELLHWFNSPQAVAEVLPVFETLHKQLACNAAQQAARAVIEQLPATRNRHVFSP